MSSPDHHHPASLNPHRALIAILFLMGGAVVFGLIVGWQWYFDNAARREAILKLAKTREADTKFKADLVSAAELREAVPESRSGPDDGIPRVSLADIARESRKDADLSAVPGESVTITLPLDATSADVQQADDLLSNYQRAAKWQDKVPFVYQPERTRVLMEQFYEVQKGSDPVAGTLLNRGRYRIDGTEILHLTHACNRPGDVLEMAMRRNAEGSFVLDWTSYVGFSQMGWEEFKRARPVTSTLFRAFATGSDYYNYEFADRKKFLSVNLLSPDGLVSLHGFCERDTPIGMALARTLSRSNTMLGIVVRLAFPEKPESDHCVWIRQFVSDRWLVLP
jgi:hypothetical protein